MVIWTWGANSHGQLGVGYANEQVEKPTLVLQYEGTVKKLACGGGHTLLIDNEGKLHSCGWNLKRQLARNDEIQCFGRTWELSGITFTNIACGWDFSCGVTDDHFLFVWGSNAYGQLGLPTIPNKYYSEIISPIRLPVNATIVSMGLRHTVIVNSKGQVWTTGCGRHGQLGLGNDILSSDRFQKVEGVGTISHIACGQNHTVAWCSEERALYVWGDNKHGQLLLCSEKYRKLFKPNKIDIGIKQQVKKILSGWTNVLLWLEDGTLLSWGRNNCGQLGTENVVPPGLYTHIKLPDGRQVKDVSLGSEHTICLATDNTIWAWGWNEHYNTGIDLGHQILQPTLVPLEIEKHSVISKIFAGGAQNFIVAEVPDNVVIDNGSK